jgi:hypothetical protein
VVKDVDDSQLDLIGVKVVDISVLGLFVVEGFNIPGLELLELKHVDVP